MSRRIAKPPKGDGNALARAFLEKLASDERKTQEKSRSHLRHELPPIDEDDPLERVLPPYQPAKEPDQVSVSPGLAAAGLLVARAFEADPDLIRRIRRETPVLVLATGTSDLVEATKIVLESCVFGSRIKVRDLTHFRSNELQRGHVAVLAQDGLSPNHVPDRGNPMVRNALSARVPIVGIAPDPDRQLPRDLVLTAERRLALPPLDHDGLALIIEAVTGSAPTRRLDDETLRDLHVSDLPTALRGRSLPDAAMKALEGVVARKRKPKTAQPRLEDLSGYGEAGEWGLALVADLRDYRAGRIGWADIDTRALLLSGVPGVGKTQLARAIANSADVPLIATSVAEWNNKDYLGPTLKAMRDVFSTAASKAPCILFIDEMDGISARDALHGHSAQYWTQVVNQLLELMSEDRPGVVTIGATNYPEKIDAALRRAGRLDREIRIERPDATALVRILRYHLGPDTLIETPLMPIAHAARGATGADVETYVRRARGTARRARREISSEDLLAEIRQGSEPLEGDPRWRVAIHEAGHAVAARKLGSGVVVDLSLTHAGGLLQLDRTFDGTATMAELDCLLAVLLAGRAAELIEFDSASIGAGGSGSSDLAMATEVAKDIEFRFGLGVLGPVYIHQSASDLLLDKALLAAVVARLRAAEGRAKAVLAEAFAAVRRIATALAENGFLAQADIDRLVDDGSESGALMDRAPAGASR